MPVRQRKPSRPAPNLPTCAELELLLERRNTEPGRQKEIDRLILSRFQCTCAVLVLDMAGFSVSVQRHGIIHHLAKIRRMHAVVGRTVQKHGGSVVKFEADNAFAAFPNVRSAVRAALEINRVLRQTNAKTTQHNAIHVAIGIGYGPILLACDDYYGDEVNLASKLGEDIAHDGEVFLTERARRSLRGSEFRFEKTDIVVSGLHLRAARLLSGHKEITKRL